LHRLLRHYYFHYFFLFLENFIIFLNLTKASSTRVSPIIAAPSSRCCHDAMAGADHHHRPIQLKTPKIHENTTNFHGFG
jgi:hypothetical protein